jgi:trk system potassium uptake protein TrkA
MQRFAVIGLGRFGQHLARALAAAGAEVIAIDQDADVVREMRDDASVAVRMNSTDVEALRSQGVSDADAAIVGIGEDFESAALTVAALKELGVRHIIARAMTLTQGTILRKVGADAIAFAERESALRWAHRLTLPRLEQYVELGEGHSLIYMRAPDSFCHKTLAELGLRRKHNVNVVAIRREVAVRRGDEEKGSSAQIVAVPQPDTKILPHDVLILVGSNESLSKLPTD